MEDLKLEGPQGGAGSQAEAEDQGREAVEGLPVPSHPQAQSLPACETVLYRESQPCPCPKSEQQSLRNSATVQASVPARRLQLSAQTCWEGQQDPGSPEKNLERQPQAFLPSGIRLIAVLPFCK